MSNATFADGIDLIEDMSRQEQYCHAVEYESIHEGHTDAARWFSETRVALTDQLYEIITAVYERYPKQMNAWFEAQADTGCKLCELENGL